MSKFTMFALVFVLATVLISAEAREYGRYNNRENNRDNNRDNSDALGGARCGRHGDPCQSTSDCCPAKTMKCNYYAKRCQIQVDIDELMAVRERITGKKGPDMK